MTGPEPNYRTKKTNITKQARFISLPKSTNRAVIHFLLIAFNLSLIQREMEFALKCEAKSPWDAHNRRQLHLFTGQKEIVSAFIFAADSVSLA